ncbi:MAG TPA: hypothetical protein VIV60_00490 [Polyangiaceae bacterium]
MDSSCCRLVAGLDPYAKFRLQFAGAGVLLALQCSPAEARAQRLMGQVALPTGNTSGDLGRDGLPANASWNVGKYSAPQSCPTETDFVAEVLARSNPSNRTHALTILHKSSVIISFDGLATQGTLVLPTSEQRKVVGASCSEVTQALALVVALQAKDDRPTAEIAPKGSTLIVDSPQLANTDSASESSMAAASPLHDFKAIEQPRASSLHLEARMFRAVARNADSMAHWAVGIGAVETFGPAPMGLFGATVFFDYWQPARLPYALVLALEGTAKGTHTVERASAEFQFWSSRIDGCLDPLASKRQLRVWLCTEGLLGLTTVTGQLGGPITRKRSAQQGWYSMGPALRVVWALPDRLRIEFSASLMAPLVHHVTKFSDPDITAYKTGLLAGSLLLKFGYEAGGSDPTRTAISQ